MINEIITGSNVDVLRKMEDESVDLTVTSPPYDNLRTYNGYSFDFDGLAKELFRVTKDGGVVVWVVNDATVKGSETGTSFKQVLGFMDVGFNLNDTMIWSKGSCRFPHKVRYYDSFEYMFILAKGKPVTVNLIADRKNKYGGQTIHGTYRDVDGTTKRKSNHNKKTIPEYGVRFNVWNLPNVGKAGNKHPAVFPEKLAEDHIVSWSNPGDIVLDPFGGSGTTAKMALKNARKFIHIDISEEYNEIARKRIAGLEAN